MTNETFKAAVAIDAADAILITAGAGMGVDSGLPDFRGNDGFWNAYPPYKRLNVAFADMASPDWFRKDPAFAWGFYGHRRNLYRQTMPHYGYGVLRRIAEKKDHFVFTSNVDTAFERASFDKDRIVECHGSIEWNQCTRICGAGITPADDETVEIDDGPMRAVGDLPSCPGCGGLARPNIMMFGDPFWDKRRTEAQLEKLYAWLKTVSNIVVVECGAGVAIPTVRELSERIGSLGRLVRINPRDPGAPDGAISIESGACKALTTIEHYING